jgi:methylase of polypeptide subunit release factors
VREAGIEPDAGGAANIAGFPGSRSKPHGAFRRLLRSFIHFFSYHFILSRQSVRRTYAAGFSLIIRPTVFHPRYFISSECFAEFIGNLDLTGKHVIDVGTGSGILALAAARAGAARVIATDINPGAALSAAENADANGVGYCVVGLCTDLLSAVAPHPLFDVIFSNLPKHAAEPLDLSDRGWHAGPDYRDVAGLFEQARLRLKPTGLLFVMLSSDSDLGLLTSLMERAGFRVRIAYEHSIFIESFILFKLSQA